MICDDAHFASWEGLEVLRSLHDESSVGVLYVAQEEFLRRVSGEWEDRRGHIYSQIWSRIAIKRRFEDRALKDDVATIADSFCPGLGKPSKQFLYKKASGVNKLRAVSNLLKMAERISQLERVKMDLALLREADRFMEA